MRKNANSRSLGKRLAQLLLSGVSRATLFIGDFILRNRLLTAGTVAFAVTLAFVSANALWYQPHAHSGVFFQTRGNWDFKATQRPLLPKAAELAEQNKKKQQKQQAAVGSVAELLQQDNQTEPVEPLNMDTLPALPANADVEIALIQQKLAALGIYNGNIDGLTGPQTRQAIEYWKQLQAKAGIEPSSMSNNAPASRQTAEGQPSPAHERNIALPAQRPRVEAVKLDKSAPVATQAAVKPSPRPVAKRIEPESQKPYQPRRSIPQQATASSGSGTTSRQITSQDIIRVQAGLKAFGNDGIVVDGVTRETTVNAVKEFRKLFNLPVNGEIDAELMAKMREIGLIS